MSDKVKGGKELLAKLARLKTIAPKLEGPMGDIGEMVRDAAIDNIDRNKTNRKGDLRIGTDFEVEKQGNKLVTVVFNSQEHALYVEFGTGPKGAANNKGISPKTNPRYRVDGWWVHTNDFPTYSEYGFKPIKIEGEEFIFTTGQPARPFLYPAIRDNQERAMEYLKEAIHELIKEEMS